MKMRPVTIKVQYLKDLCVSILRLISWFSMKNTKCYGCKVKRCFKSARTFQINDTILEGVRVVIYEPISTYDLSQRAALIFLHGGGWSRLSVGKCQ